MFNDCSKRFHGLIPWMRVLEKLVVFHLVKELSAFYGTRRVFTVFRKAHYCALSWASWIQSSVASDWIKRDETECCGQGLTAAASYSGEQDVLIEFPSLFHLSPSRICQDHTWNYHFPILSFPLFDAVIRQMEIIVKYTDSNWKQPRRTRHARQREGRIA
jgi:hypothetical protein